jgi:DNA-binding NtrC family response regulator
MPRDGRASDFISTGEFNDAVERLRARPQLAAPDRLLRAHMELETGDSETAVTKVEALLRDDLNAPARAFCLGLYGRALGRRGSIEEGVSYQRKAVALASTCDSSLSSELIAHLVTSLLSWIGIEPALAELPNLRRIALESGNTQSLADYHITNARIATMRGSLLRATRESLIAYELISRSPNALQLWKIRQVQSNVAIKACHLTAAQAYAEECLALARQFGSKLSIGTSLGNLAHIFSAKGEFDRGRGYLASALESFDSASHMRIAAYSTGIEIGLGSGDDLFAETMIARRAALEEHTSPRQLYNDLWFELSHAKWLVRSGRYQEAAERVTAAYHDVATLADADLLDRMALLAAEAYAKAGSSELARNMFNLACSTLQESNLETIAEQSRVAAVVIGSRNPQRAQLHISRAWRLLTAAGLLGNRMEVQRTASSLGLKVGDFAPQTGVVGMIAALDACASVLQLGLHPRALGSEVLELLKATDACEAAVIASEENGRLGAPLEGIGTDAGKAALMDRHDIIRTYLGPAGENRLVLLALPSSRPNSEGAWLMITQLVRAAADSAAHRLSREENITLWPVEESPFELGMVAASKGMVELINTSRKLAVSQITVLITGETGTGKELLARALHEASPRKDKPFIPFNCSAFARDMLDAQLFGYRRGAFTGAHEAFQGVIRAASGGTLFLDEIGELTPDVQPKLLRFLESREIHPLGELKPITVDVRIVAATNADLEQLVADGRFREDLFYRLNVVPLKVPPLRERREEIPLLVQHYLETCSREFHKTGLRVSQDTMEYLILYNWPGNVRRLANEVRRLVALAESGAVLMPEHLSPDIAASRRTRPPSERDLAATEFVVRSDQPMSAAIDHVERTMIQRALQIAQGRLEDAARLLGLSRKGLYLKRQRLGLTEASEAALIGRPTTPGA